MSSRFNANFSFMIAALRSSHPFFFSVSSFLLLLALFPVFNNENFSSTHLGPYYLMHFIPGYLKYLIGAFVLFYSSLLINRIVNQSVLFNRNFYLPGLFYISLMLFFPANGTLHPMAISNLFSILCFGHLIQVYRNESCKNHIFKACCWTLLAVFCFPSYCVLFILPWISLLIIRPFVWKEYMMPILSLVFFGIYLIAYLLFFDSTLNVFNDWLSSLLFYSVKIDVRTMGALGVLVFVTLSLSFKIIFFIYGRSTNRFKKVIKLLLVYFVLCVLQVGLSVFIFKSNSLSIYGAFVPLSVLISFVFMHGKKLWIIDSLFIVYLLSSFIIAYLG